MSAATVGDVLRFIDAKHVVWS